MLEHNNNNNNNNNNNKSNNNNNLIGLISRQTGITFSQPASGNVGVDPEMPLLSSVEKVGPTSQG
jgi:hypothetical protein